VKKWLERNLQNFRTAAARIIDKSMDQNELEQVESGVGLNWRIGLLVTWPVELSGDRASSSKLDRVSTVSQGGIVH